MGVMVAHPEGALDELGHALGGPEIAPKAKGFGASTQEVGQVRPLLGGQLGSRSGSGMTTQGLLARAPSALEPLAHGSLTHAQGTGDLALFPARLSQIPGTQTAIFFPIVWVEMGVLVHMPPSNTFRTTFTNSYNDQ